MRMRNCDSKLAPRGRQCFRHNYTYLTKAGAKARGMHIAVESSPIVEPNADGVGEAFFTRRLTTLSNRISAISIQDV